ncbi:hypothetical protein BDU57DRAFT_512214 [Ampelomyces quisqualis]|uniref:Uncharacterized protein n=1 Tax=Ampelomyces quisqualis TaxID=50730 RepID=A0A6A5QUU6_AMPQU|nr:hypothetical protein BDU57DRAFT_512214 [Ampelomyces quisqualis]
MLGLFQTYNKHSLSHFSSVHTVPLYQVQKETSGPKNGWNSPEHKGLQRQQVIEAGHHLSKSEFHDLKF